MLSVSRLVSRVRRAAIARITLAVMLTLVLLAGVVPLSSLSSSASSHECGMACCAGKPSHMAGSCSTAFSTEEEAETPGPPDEEEHSAHGHTMPLSGVTSPAQASAKQHGAAQRSPAHHSTADVKSPRAASVASQAMTTPCAPECAAATISSSQVRRPRDPASLVVAVRPHTPTSRFFNGRFTVPAPKSAEARRLSRPRAPPSLLNHLSA